MGYFFIFWTLWWILIQFAMPFCNDYNESEQKYNYHFKVKCIIVGIISAIFSYLIVNYVDMREFISYF